MPASATSRLEPCGYTWDEVTCEEAGAHLCLPRAARAVGFYEEILVHTKGRWARKPFTLTDWQRDEIIVPLFGTAHWEDQLEEYVRQYTLAWLELARKNGKSELVAGGGLLLLVGDDEEEAEVYGCLDPETPILCGDLVWRPLGSVTAGHELVALDEYPSPGRQRKMRMSTVVDRWPTRKPSIRLIFEDGREVICSTDHRWLTTPPLGNLRQWRPARKLAPGHRVLAICRPWKQGQTRDHGYLAGLYDGEGSLHAPLRPGASFRICFTQKPGLVLDDYRSAMKRLGFQVAYSAVKDSTGVYSEVVTGLWDTLRLLGEVRPARLLARHRDVWEGHTPGNDARMLRIAGVEQLGDRDLCEITTTTGTYVAAGLVSHNCAKDRDQAGVVYQVAKRMVELSPVLSKRLTVVDSKKRIIDPKTGSFYQVVASDAGGNLGKNPSGILFDEVITQPNRELWNDLKTGAGARDQTLMIAATTAGNDPSAMAAEEHLHSERVLADPSLDPARFVFMRNTSPDVDWTDEANWYHANPGLGDFLRIQVLRDEAKEAATSPRKQNTFFQFRLNRWVRQVTRWLDLALWDENAGLVVPEKLKGLDAYGGLDLASTSDFAAWVLLFPGAIREAGGVTADGVLARFWLPQAAVEARKDMRDVLAAWQRAGYLSITPGDVISLPDIRRQIDRDMGMFRVRRVGYDRWGATEITGWMRARLGEDQVVGIPQTTSALNAPSKELERRLGLRQLRHGGHPVLRWMADNVQAFTDSSGNIKPDRRRSNEKIDGIAALVDALFVEIMPKASSFAFVLGD